MCILLGFQCSKKNTNIPLQRTMNQGLALGWYLCQLCWCYLPFIQELARFHSVRDRARNTTLSHFTSVVLAMSQCATANLS